jgi:hypothetical protein
LPLNPGKTLLAEPTVQLTEREDAPEGRLRVRVIAAAGRGDGQRFTGRIERSDIPLPHCDVAFRTGKIESELPARVVEEHRQTGSATLSRPDPLTTQHADEDAFLCWEGGAGAKCDFAVAPGVFDVGQRCSVRIRLVDVGVAEIDLSAAPHTGAKWWRLKQWVDLRDNHRTLTASVHVDIKWLTAVDVAKEAKAIADEQQRFAAEEAAVQQRIVAEQIAERERIAAEDAAAQQRAATDAAAEQERIAAERAASEAVEQERIAAQEAAERERICAEEAAEHVAQQAAERERIAAEQAAQRERILAEEDAAQAAVIKKEEEEEAAKAAVHEVSVVDRQSQTSPDDLLSGEDQMVFIQCAFQLSLGSSVLDCFLRCHC